MRYAVLRGLDRDNVFWTTVRPDESWSDVVKAEDGRVAYELLGAFETPEAAQALWQMHYSAPDIIGR